MRYYSMIMAIIALIFTFSINVTSAQTEITFWHSMGGQLGLEVENLVDDFNKSQSDYKIVASYKGEYEETMISTIAAFRAKQQPVLVQIYEVGTGTMMAAQGAVYPVYKLMQDTKESFDSSAYLPVISGYYTDTANNMLSMPFNASTPLLYYNKDVFKKAGLDPEKAPQTWQDVEAFSKKILETKAASCGFTMTYAAHWIGLENFSAWHNLPFGTKENGFGGLEASLIFNDVQQIRLWKDLKKWSDDSIFRYGGPAGGLDSAPMFIAQQCAMFIQSSGSIKGIVKQAKFNVGFGMLPYYADVKGAPQNSIIGGASLWVLQGHNSQEYKGAAKFLNFLSLPENQVRWHQNTGYLPLTKRAYELSEQQGFYAKNPGADIAIKQVSLNLPTENSKGVRFGNMPQIRSILDQELEAVLNGSKQPKAALDNAVMRGNEIVRDFEAANK